MLASELPGILRHTVIDVRVILSMPTLMFLWKLSLGRKLLKGLLDFSSLAPHLLNQFSISGGCGRKPGNMNQMLPQKNGGIYFLSVIFKFVLGEGRVFYVQIHYLQVCMATAAGVEPSHPSLDYHQHWFHRLFCNSPGILAEKKIQN